MDVVFNSNGTGWGFWSKDIEKDADILIHLNKTDELDLVEFKVEKNRDGLAGVSWNLRFDKPHQLFDIVHT